MKVSVLSHAFLGLSANSSYWGYASSVKWGVYGTSLTATYNFQGLTETLYITPSTRYTGLPIVETERYADGTSYTFPTQYFARA